jgi:tetratricopeptide (TPR) repeat protein
VLLLTLVGSVYAAEVGQYRSRVQVDPTGQAERGRQLSVEELERQIGSIEDPYARSSAGRHLARHYVEQEQYDKAVDYYREALSARGLSDVANREMLRELAQVYMLKEDYAAAAATMQRALAIDLVPATGDFLLLARAHYHRRDYVAVVAALDRIEEAGLTLDLAQTRQALALYYRAGAWSQCEALLGELIEREPNNPENWHQLAAVYLQQNKKRRALDQLALAREKGVPFRQEDLNLLVDLKVVNGNPYGAAETLGDAVAAGELPANGANYRKQFELWFQAREQERALRALVQAARLSGDTQLYLYLAQLQMEQESWSDMYSTMQSACAQQLEDRYVSRANLFLGISQLKLGDETGARRSFINATLVGGANLQAAQWLDYMEAAPATEKELRRVEGLCYGAGDKQREVAALSGSDVGASPVQDGEAADLQFKQIPRQRLFYIEFDGSVEELAPRIKALATRMAITLAKSGGTTDGPLQIIVTEQDGERSVQLARPVRGSPPAGGKYRVRSAAAMRVAYRLVQGSAGELAAAGQAMAESLLAAGYELTGELRLVLPAGGSAPEGELEVEVQLGIQP